ncbi:PIG-L family deacetylase [Alkalitalea saponilacus]|uniref:GlcNAc-PI de-N-acetylase n=1 Tax=Alkalitalea saponilacus TaxID=889453 RepID=A0A1T5G7S3_9BACT|nr:PIG-L family deacetylase [Alkalitalea saponilacus]ASB51006.1 PIG-L family deacetylase [Alkalitalea saponilacus]SKC04371.1 GlcNAc-PI de-N-acetylase [Alkalitalea saponilacus]
MLAKEEKTAVVIVAHPDDETLWSGGVILSHPTYKWFIISLCRGKDTDRAPKFIKALKALKAKGAIGDLDDGPEQTPLATDVVENAILELLPVTHFDMIITHSPFGEYTRHFRHEEIGKAVVNLWNGNKIAANCLWAYAYEDGNKSFLPRPIEGATVYMKLPKLIWIEKFKIIIEIYGFKSDSWEAKTTPKTESFWQFDNPLSALRWLERMK